MRRGYPTTWEGWVYLATVIDCHTRAVIGYAMADHYKTSLISAAIDAATLNSRPRKTLDWKTPAEALDEHLRSLQQADVATIP